MSKTIKNYDEVYDTYEDKQDETVKGIVCLSVGTILRLAPKYKSQILKTVPQLTELTINLTESKKGWYCVEVLPGLKAYCLKETIELVMEE